MVRQVFPLCLANHNLKLSIIDGPAFPELAEADNVKSLPTLIVDKHFRWTAVVDTDELLQVISSRDPAELGTAALKGMIQEGNAYGLSEMMLTYGKIFPAFVELLIHPEFSVRLGAMAAIEEARAAIVTRLIDRQQCDAACGIRCFARALSRRTHIARKRYHDRGAVRRSA